MVSVINMHFTHSCSTSCYKYHTIGISEVFSFKSPFCYASNLVLQTLVIRHTRLLTHKCLRSTDGMIVLDTYFSACIVEIATATSCYTELSKPEVLAQHT